MSMQAQRTLGQDSPAASRCARASAATVRRRRCPGSWRSAFYFVFPRYLGFGTELLITMLFAISPRSRAGLRGIVTLGHAAFFRRSAPIRSGCSRSTTSGPSRSRGSVIAAIVAGGLIGLRLGLMLLRTTGLTLLMLTLCTMAAARRSRQHGREVHRRLRRPADSLPIQPHLPAYSSSTCVYSAAQYLYVLGVLFVVLHVRAHAGLFAVRPEPHRHPRERAAHACGRRAGAHWRLVTCYAISAALAGVAGGLWAQANAYVNLSTSRPRSRRAP